MGRDGLLVGLLSLPPVLSLSCNGTNGHILVGNIPFQLPFESSINRDGYLQRTSF